MAHRTGSLGRVLRLMRELPLEDKLRLIGLLTEDLREEMEREGDPVDMLSLAGLGAEVDVDEYVDQERGSWDR